MVAKLDGKPSHETVERAIVALENLEHRGAAGADPNTGDGAGILLQLPDEFFRGEITEDLPPPGAYGVCVCFLPRDEARREELEQLLEDTVRAEGQRVVGWRDVPVDKDYVGITANLYAPYIKQLVVAASDELATDQDAFERKLYVIRRVAEIAAGPELVIPSFSSRTIVYKGMLTSPQVLGYFPDLADPRTKSALALVHSRFSTNTFPSWELAHPYRMIAHNGEINTLRGNVNWMRARESQLASELFGDDLQKVLPIVRPGGSDSATFDNVLELLVLAGRSLPHAVMMMIPEAYQDRDDLPEELLGFYAFHSCLMEPWDGPAAVAFTDGRVIGATLDRNGLRPGRWLETEDGWVVLGSESGVMDEAPANVKRKGRLQPGKLFLVDLERGVIVDDGEVKNAVATQAPYAQWFEEGIVHLADLPPAPALPTPEEPLHERQRAFGFTQEDLRVLLAPTAAKAEEPIGSMGNDAALAVLSDHQPPLFSYFKQLFAQVTNPPIDPIREAIVMSVGSGVGSEANLLDESPAHAHQLSMQTPILFDRELQQLRHVDSSVFKAHTVDVTWPIAEGPDGHGQGARARLRGGRRRARRRRQHPDPLRPRGQPRAGADPGAAGGRGRAPPPGARGHAPADRPRARVRRAARGPPLRDADRLRRLRDQPVPDVRVAADAGRRRPRPRRDRLRDRAVERRQGHRQGPAEDDLQDGHLDDPVLQRGADLRGRRPGPDADRALLRRHRVADRRHRRRHPRARDAGPPRARVRPALHRRPAAGRRRLRVAPRGRAPHVEPGDDRAPAALGPPRRAADLRRVLQAHQPGRGAPRDPARPAQVPRAARGSVARHRRRRAGERDRQALRHRRDVARARSAARRTRRWRSR